MATSIITGIIFGSIIILTYTALKAIKTFNRDLEQSVLFKPQVKYNNKLYLMDKIKRWNDDEETGKWLILEQSQGDIITEFTVNNQKFIAIYKKADDVEDQVIMFQLKDIHESKLDINTIISIDTEVSKHSYHSYCYLRIRTKPTEQHTPVTFKNFVYKNKDALLYDYDRLLGKLAAYTNSHEY